MKTQSELLFEHYCEATGFSCMRVAEGTSKTPDYEVMVDGHIIVVEITAIERNPAERESDRKLAERNCGTVTGGTPGARVRSKIDGSAKQLKARMRGVHPSMLVLYDRGDVLRHLDSYHVRVAMYGLDVLHLTVPTDPAQPSRIVGQSGPKRKMTPVDNTSISAIGVLYKTSTGAPTLVVYHNDFAGVPLDVAVLAKHGIKQRTHGSQGDWTDVQ